MSQDEHHTGKLKLLLPLIDEDLEGLCRRILKEESIELDATTDIIDCFDDELRDKYVRYKQYVYKIEDHEEDDGSDSYIKMQKTEDGISFDTKFYNGGTCLSEMLEDGLDRLLG